MLPAIHTSANKALAAAWETIAPGVPIVFGHPIPPATLPADCLRVYWLEYGGETTTGGEIYSLLQLDVFTSGGRRGLALRQADGLSAALHLGANAGGGRLGLFDDAEKLVGLARVLPLERGWTNGETDSPDLVALSRTVQLLSTPLV